MKQPVVLKRDFLSPVLRSCPCCHCCLAKSSGLLLESRCETAYQRMQNSLLGFDIGDTKEGDNGIPLATFSLFQHQTNRVIESR